MGLKRDLKFLLFLPPFHLLCGRCGVLLLPLDELLALPCNLLPDGQLFPDLLLLPRRLIVGRDLVLVPLILRDQALIVSILRLDLLLDVTVVQFQSGGECCFAGHDRSGVESGVDDGVNLGESPGFCLRAD